MGRSLLAENLFAGHHPGLQPALGQSLVILEREQAQRRQIGAGRGRRQMLQGRVGLAGIGRPHMEDDAAAKASGDRELLDIRTEPNLVAQAPQARILPCDELRAFPHRSQRIAHGSAEIRSVMEHP